MSVCEGCGVPVPPSRGAIPRKWCSERCRKQQYSVPCVDCGKPLNGSDGRGPNAAVRCVKCSGAISGAKRTVWTREAIVRAIREWAELYGEPPAMPDWSPSSARHLGNPERAERFLSANGRWPWATKVHQRFGSWNAALEAAGFKPRAPHGGDGNQLRRRTKAAA